MMSSYSSTSSEEVKDCRSYELFGRNLLSYFFLIINLLTHYFLIYIFFMVALVIRLQCLDSKFPYYAQGDGLITLGLSVRPRPSRAEDVLAYKNMKIITNDPHSYNVFADDMRKCIDGQRMNDSTALVCDVDLGPESNITQENFQSFRRCQQSRDARDLCTHENKFGFPEGKPCFALGITRIMKWKPASSHSKSRALPIGMPSFIKGSYDPDCIYISCEGNVKMGHKRRNIVNVPRISYIPDNCIRKSRLPSFNELTCAAKSIIVKVEPNLKKTLNIRCTLWDLDKDWETHQHDANQFDSAIFELTVVNDREDPVEGDPDAGWLSL